MKEQTYLIVDGGRSWGNFERTSKEVFDETIKSFVNGSGPDVPEDQFFEGCELSEDFLFIFKDIPCRFVGMEDSSMIWIAGSLTDAELQDLWDTKINQESFFTDHL